jgi:hypothetical protein
LVRLFTPAALVRFQKNEVAYPPELEHVSAYRCGRVVLRLGRE